LTKGCEYGKEQFEDRYDEMFPVQSDLYKIIVVVDNSSGKIIGAGSLILERKFIRNAGVVCTQFLIFDYFSFNPFFLFFLGRPH